MGSNTGSYPASAQFVHPLVKFQWMGRITLVCEAVVFLGMAASSSAFGSHLTLPGSQDLHQKENAGQQSLTRQLEAINNYTSPHASSNRDGEIRLDEKDNFKPSTLPTDEQPSAVSTFPLPAVAAKPGSDVSPAFPSADVAQSGPSRTKMSRHAAQDHTEMGWMFLLSGRLHAAMAAYREALRHHSDSAAAHIGMGITLKSLGKAEPAKQAIQQALKLNPRLSSALVHLGYLYADGPMGHSDSERARRLFNQALRLGDPFAGIALLDLQSRPHSK